MFRDKQIQSVLTVTINDNLLFPSAQNKCSFNQDLMYGNAGKKERKKI